MGSGISVGLVSGMIEQKSIYVRDGEVFKSEAERVNYRGFVKIMNRH